MIQTYYPSVYPKTYFTSNSFPTDYFTYDILHNILKYEISFKYP